MMFWTATGEYIREVHRYWSGPIGRAVTAYTVSGQLIVAPLSEIVIKP